MGSLSIRNMHRTEALREELVEEYWQRRDELAKLKLDFGDAMAALRAADPRGWERYYDIELPDFRWKDTERVREAIKKIYDHIDSVAGNPA